MQTTLRPRGYILTAAFVVATTLSINYQPHAGLQLGFNRAAARKLTRRARRRIGRRLRRLAVLRMGRGQYARAARYLTRSYRLLRDPTTLVLLARCYERTKRYKAAVGLYRRLLRRRYRGVDRAKIRESYDALLLKLQPPPDTSTPKHPVAHSQPTTQPTSQPASQPTSPDVALKDAGDKRFDALVDQLDDDSPAARSKPSGAKLFDLRSDKLDIGGLLYLRFNASITESSDVDDHSLSMPNLLDPYLDARPNDRLRAFVRGRLTWNPFLDTEANPNAKQVNASLNELWMKFDIARAVFVTLGLQKIKWGTSKVWNPVDAVNTALRPIFQPFDSRNGVPLVKLHMPVESLGWNFYLLGVLDRVNSIDKAGGAARAQFVISTFEFAFSGALRKNVDPRAGFEFSAGLGYFDFTGEVGIRFSDEYDNNMAIQTSGGVTFTHGIFERDSFIVGLEYFYNQLGVDTINPADVFSGRKQFFYVGRHYASAFVSLPRPGSLDEWNFGVSAVANLTDRSAIVRADVSVIVLTYLTIQLFAVVHVGQIGELHLSDKLYSRYLKQALYGDPSAQVPTQAVDLGLWLRLNL